MGHVTERSDFEDVAGARIRAIDPAPAPPRDEMWASIEFARRLASPRTRRRPPAGMVGLGLAASLALGITIGRMSGRGEEAPVLNGPLTSLASADGVAPDASAFYQLVAEEHMVEAEILLAGLDEAAPERPDDVAAWARSLLMDTRLLIGSPAAGDPDRARLLLDLELVLAQIAALPPADPAPEIEIIRDGIRQNNVLARLRSATDALAAAGM